MIIFQAPKRLGVWLRKTYVIRRDWVLIKTSKSFEIFAYIVAFWGLFMLSIFTPSITLFRGGWMWFIRGCLEGQHQRFGLSRKSSYNSWVGDPSGLNNSST